MSIRRTPTSPVAAPAVSVDAGARPFFNLPTNRLHTVLRAGHAQTAVDVSDEAFEMMVHNEVEDIGAKMKMSKEERNRMKAEALRVAKKKGMQGVEKGKKASKYAAKKSKEGATELVDFVQRSWAGAKNPAHWLTLSTSNLSSRLIKDYKRAIEKKGWENVKKSASATRVIYAESSANMHARLEISRKDVKIEISNSMIGSSESVHGDKTFGSQVDDMAYSQFTKVTDALIKELVAEFKMKFVM